MRQRNFSARRDFANKTAFNSFWHEGWHQNRWHNHHFFHIGWIGPWFWPYAYGDFFYFALWPWDYWWYDPFWAYGYGDIYQAVFFPYSYDDYVQGPRAPERMARLKQGIVQGCNEEAGEVTVQIQSAVQPDQRQGPLLDDLGNAIVKASDEIRSHCQANVAFTPTARLAQMHDRLAALGDGVNIVSPALTAFYDSLSDEQKARFDHIAPRAPRHGQAALGDLTTATIRGQCDAGMMAWPTDQIDRVVRPDDAQRAKLQALQSAAAQAADTIKGACPSDVPATPPARAPARDAARGRDHAAVTCGFLQLAKRRPEGALQHDGPAIVRAECRKSIEQRVASECLIQMVPGLTSLRLAAKAWMAGTSPVTTHVHRNSLGNFARNLTRRSALTSTTSGNVPLSFMS